MTVISPPNFMSVDGVYQGRHLGVPYRDIMSEGVVGANDLKVSQRGAGANLSVDVAAGVAWVAGDDAAATQPLYRCYNDGTVNLAIATADATNPRIDRVIAEVRDSAFAGVSQDWRLRVITGTPAGSPSAPALPGNAISLATVSVPAADTTITDNQITDTRVRVSVGSGAARRPTALAIRDTTQSLGNGTWTAISFNSETGGWDNGVIHDTVTNPSRMTVTTPGLYMVTGCVAFTGNVTGMRGTTITQNGTGVWTTHAPAHTAGTQLSHVSGLVNCAAGDYIELYAFQNSGGALNSVADSSFGPTRLAVALLGSV